MIGAIQAKKVAMVRAAGIEPALLSELDFESSASTNSTTPASCRLAPMWLLVRFCRSRSLELHTYQAAVFTYSFNLSRHSVAW